MDEVTVQDYKTLIFFTSLPASTLSVSHALFLSSDWPKHWQILLTTSKDNFVCLYVIFLRAPSPD